MKLFFLLISVMLLGACGVTETAVTAAAVASSKAKELQEAQKTQARIQEQLDLANKQQQQRLQEAESAAAR